MHYLKCTYCGHLNEVKTEYLTLCSECNKRLENNYKDWKEIHPEKSYEDFMSEVCIEMEEQQTTACEPEAKPKKLSPAKYVVIFLAAIASLYLIGHFAGNYIRGFISTKEHANINKTMINIAGKINKSCPLMVDADFRLDNVEVLPHQVMQYNYTFVKYDKDSCDIKKMKNYLQTQIIKYIKTNPQAEMKELKEAKITFNYDYRDLNHNHLFTISVNPRMYQ